MSFLRPCGRSLLSAPTRPTAQAQVGGTAETVAATATGLLVAGFTIALGAMAVYDRGFTKGCNDCRNQDRKWVLEGKSKFI